MRFSSKRLQALILDERAMTKRYGKEVEKAVGLRLRHMFAVPHVADLFMMPGRWHTLQGNRKGQLASNLSRSHRLIIAPSTNPSPTHEDSIIWKQVDDVTIIEIVDYH